MYFHSLVTRHSLPNTALFNPQKVVNFFKTFCSAINHPKSGRHRPGMVLHLSARLALRLALAGSLMGGAWAGQTETRMALLNLGLPIMPKGGGTMGKTIRSGDLVRLHSELHTALRRETGGKQGCGTAPAAPPRPALRTSATAVHLPSLPCLFCGVAARACACACACMPCPALHAPARWTLAECLGVCVCRFISRATCRTTRIWSDSCRVRLETSSRLRVGVPLRLPSGQR